MGGLALSRPTVARLGTCFSVALTVFELRVIFYFSSQQVNLLPCDDTLRLGQDVLVFFSKSRI